MIVIIWAFSGWVNSKVFKPAFSKLTYYFNLFLYLQLFTGVFLYFFLKHEMSATGMSLEQAVDQSNIRFWVIEHVSLMIFALLISQIGRFFIKQISSDRRKFRAATFYYGMSCLVVIVSAVMAIFR
ncbi:MAG: hypothetical protein K9H49_05105 [Bacteroidales bacterium]|nr:hypothetical protein [Bacteroidales bacterium]MCF8389871.1 hypothetical protein [Bacteroidales bacterium]